MATLTNNTWHDHSGARWLIPMLAVVAAVVVFFYLMLFYGYT
jgi:hypothetical protein